MENGAVRRPVSGTPQGGVISPLLCNMYLNWLDRAWRPGWGRLVRYADDLLVTCRSRGQAQAALAELTDAASRSRSRAEAREDTDRATRRRSAGVRFPRVPPSARALSTTPRNRRVCLSARWPSQRAVQHARDRIRFMTMRARLVAPVDQVVAEVNRFLRGWTGYFRFGNSAWVFDKISSYALMRIALFTGQAAPAQPSLGVRPGLPVPVNLGLVSLNGIVVAPRPNRPWRAPAAHRR